MRSKLRARGFTLPEMMVATAVGSLMLGGLMVASSNLQRWFAAAEFVIGCQQEQATVLDYIGRDIRRAASASLANGDRRLNLAVPDLSSRAADGTVQVPALSGTRVQYGVTQTTVSYYVQGASLVREDGSGVVELATKIDEFHTDLSLPGVVQLQLLFKPAPRRSARPPVMARINLRNSAASLQ